MQWRLQPLSGYTKNTTLSFLFPFLGLWEADSKNIPTVFCGKVLKDRRGRGWEGWESFLFFFSKMGWNKGNGGDMLMWMTGAEKEEKRDHWNSWEMDDKDVVIEGKKTQRGSIWTCKANVDWGQLPVVFRLRKERRSHGRTREEKEPLSCSCSSNSENDGAVLPCNVTSKFSTLEQPTACI